MFVKNRNKNSDILLACSLLYATRLRENGVPHEVVDLLQGRVE